MKHAVIALMCALFVGGQPALSDDKRLILLVSPELIEIGLMGFLMPRFSLKTGIKVAVEPAPQSPPKSVLILNKDPGTPVLGRKAQVYSLSRPDPTNKAALRFSDWLQRDIGQRTIEQFTIDGAQIFNAIAVEVKVGQTANLAGNAARGETLAYDNCGRCHVIGAKNRMKGIGSTPSFALLRGFDDWQDRFFSFYALNPHPSFTQITGVTAPFNPTTPPAISPLSISQQDHSDIIAFVSSIKPVDLGAPLVHQ